jgi:CHAD domain-containing protein
VPALEFCLPPADIQRLLSLSPFTRSGRPAVVNWIWHDTATAELAGRHLSLCEAGGHWRVQRSSPMPGEAWPPGTPAALVAEATDLAALSHPLPGPLMPIARFHGNQRILRHPGAEPATLTIVNGMLRGVAQERATCRIVLEGPAALLQEASSALAAALPITVPLCSLATEAIALARGLPAPPRQSGGPEVPAGTSLADAIALVIGHLTDVILAGVPGAVAAASPEPVHAMRVALRRLRAALSIFRRAGDGPAFAALQQPLRDLGAVLGLARDWDVFLDGTGQEVAAAFPEDRRITALLTAATKQRQAAYDGLRRFFGSAEFRLLSVSLVQLAALRPWETDGDQAATMQAEVTQYAAETLARQHSRMLKAGRHIAELPVEQLHDLRKRGKRLRYTAEFFAPLYHGGDARRFVRRLAALQEELGHLNDGAAAAGLMQSLRGGHFAAGVVQGFAAARSTDRRTAIAASWSRFRKAEPFWT